MGDNKTGVDGTVDVTFDRGLVISVLITEGEVRRERVAAGNTDGRGDIKDGCVVSKKSHFKYLLKYKSLRNKK